MAFRRDRSIRDVYEDRFPMERGGAYRRSGFGRPDEDYGRGFEYDNPRFYPGGGPPRSYHGDGPHFPAEHRAGPPGRRDESYQYYRGAREEPLPGRPMDFRGGRGGPLPPPGGRGQGSYPPPPRPLPPLGPEAGDDTVMQAILSLDRGEDHEGLRPRKAPFPAVRDRSPLRRDVPPSPHSRSGSSISSRSFSPDRGKAHPYPPPPCKKREKPSAPFISGSRDGSPHSSASVSKEEAVLTDPLTDEAPPSTEEPSAAFYEDFQERRGQAIAAKAREIEKVYRQDCETFGMVVKMLVSKEPTLEKLLQVPLKENLGDIRERCLDDLRSFIASLDDIARHAEPSV
ncbi:periphilin-1 [Alosa pseudoharengus]|uniref:periphilin-1 n=1 Tax=Alosa pseudoharengus TaxID=34774 RepID=UPI003F8AFD4C